MPLILKFSISDFTRATIPFTISFNLFFFFHFTYAFHILLAARKDFCDSLLEPDRYSYLQIIVCPGPPTLSFSIQYKETAY